ncbi:unannotated protein [freshwater metagenome]|uniref:Unannotated protein n=1 Tax=freshwater metagenome TaxID=449393 RepID=A0A6J6EK08_9ZZZZ
MIVHHVQSDGAVVDPTDGFTAVAVFAPPLA